MELGTLLCILSLAVAIGGCFPVPETTAAKSDTMQVLPQTVEHRDNSLRAPKEEEGEYRTAIFHTIVIIAIFFSFRQSK
nr:unnamed protein product [Callosobruchus analis]